MLDSICDVMKEAYSRGWISTRDGNCSYRRKGEDVMYITPSGVRKQHLNSEMLIKLKLIKTSENELRYERVLDEEPQVNNAGLKPSGELLLHLLLQYNWNASNRIVLHLHPTLL